MTPSSPPQTRVERRTPAPVRCRPASTYLPTPAAATANAPTANAVQATPPPVMTAHTRTAPSTRRLPGSTWTTTPRSPAAITSPTSSSPAALTGAPNRRRVDARAARSAPEDRDRDVDDDEARDPTEEARGDLGRLAPAHDDERGHDQRDEELDPDLEVVRRVAREARGQDAGHEDAGDERREDAVQRPHRDHGLLHVGQDATEHHGPADEVQDEQNVQDDSHGLSLGSGRRLSPQV